MNHKRSINRPMSSVYARLWDIKQVASELKYKVVPIIKVLEQHTN